MQHEWVRPSADPTLASPDPEPYVQYQLMAKALHTIVESNGWPMEDVHVWLDYSCGMLPKIELATLTKPL